MTKQALSVRLYGKPVGVLEQTAQARKNSLTWINMKVCTRVYQNLSTNMAMKIGNKYKQEEILATQWEQVANEITYRYLFLKKLIPELGN